MRLALLVVLACLSFFTYAAPKPIITPTPIIVDTDMGFDDWMALSYLLNDPNVAIKAITVVGTGETHCKPGLQNLANILSFVGKPNIPFSCGPTHPLAFNNQFPILFRTTSDAFNNIKMPHSRLKPSRLTAPQLIEKTLLQSPHKMSIITIGPLTNIALALNHDPLIIKHIKMIYIGGGAVNHSGDLNIPGINVSKNTRAEFNIYADPLAASEVLKSDSPITMIPLNASDMTPITLKSYHFIMHHQGTANAHLVARILTRQLQIQKSFFHLDYWDPTTVVTSMNPGVIKKIKSLKLIVNTQPGHLLGATLESPKGNPVNVVLQIYPQKFYDAFLNSVTQKG
jgi:inosine-uridine nucleoside N-ribohydrolase